MSYIATTISQSRKLIELGLNPETADMVWVRYAAGGYRLEVLHRELFERIMETDIPAWSLSALLEVMPNEYQPLLRKECKWYMDAWYEYGNLIAGGCYKPLDAAYEMVCKMLERGLIEKGGDQ